jgi:hypothetical protein
MKKIIIFSTLFINSVLFSQTVITGRIIDRDNANVNMAGVKIQNKELFDKGLFITTDFDGSFKITVSNTSPKIQNYLFINFLGYKPLTLNYQIEPNNTKLDLGDIVMVLLNTSKNIKFK